MQKLPLSAIVVCFNEGHFLPACLASLDFCDEIIVVDLGSSDDSVSVAQTYGATVLTHVWVPIGEQALASLLPRIRHAWLLRADPDEVFSPYLARRLGDLLSVISDNVAAIALPYRHFFQGKPVAHTSWGVLNSHVVKVYRKDSIRVTGHVHNGIFTPEGSDTAFINAEPEDRVQHHTAPTIRSRLVKIKRYVPLEGEGRHARGMRFRLSELLIMPLRILWRELYIYESWRDGWNGITIALLQAVYEFLSWLSLWRWERSQSGARQ